MRVQRTWKSSAGVHTRRQRSETPTSSSRAARLSREASLGLRGRREMRRPESQRSSRQQSTPAIQGG